MAGTQGTGDAAGQGAGCQACGSGFSAAGKARSSPQGQLGDCLGADYWGTVGGFLVEWAAAQGATSCYVQNCPTRRRTALLPTQFA